MHFDAEHRFRLVEWRQLVPGESLDLLGDDRFHHDPLKDWNEHFIVATLLLQLNTVFAGNLSPKCSLC